MDTLSTKLDLLIKNLRAKKSMIGFAESCTGGKLSAKLSEIPGISNIFSGSIVSYSNSVKEDVLGVLRDTLKNEGAVSQAVALQMAKGAQLRLKTQWAGAITGIAGPDGGTVDKPVGTVCFAIVGPSIEWTGQQLFKGVRIEVQNQSIEYLVEQLNLFLNTNNTRY